MKKNTITKQQKLFQEMFVGILLYSVVLGFFNDYTNLLHTGTYSVTFAVAVVMQVLTYLTFKLKDRVVVWFKHHDNVHSKYILVFSIWLIMFVSKFVFLAVIDLLFNEVEISGFIALLIIIATMTVAQKAVSYIYQKLGE